MIDGRLYEMTLIASRPAEPHFAESDSKEDVLQDAFEHQDALFQRLQEYEKRLSQVRRAAYSPAG